MLFSGQGEIRPQAAQGSLELCIVVLPSTQELEHFEREAGEAYSWDTIWDTMVTMID